MLNGWFELEKDLDKVPHTEGVYLLANVLANYDKKVVYVGRADDLHDRLLQHPDPSNPCLQREKPEYFAYEETSNSEAREARLTSVYNPICDRTDS